LKGHLGVLSKSESI
jgi:transglutaminase/protease-like cytokinesis protein 3